MITEFYRICGGEEDAQAIERAAQIIRRGGLVAFPTETVYGLGASALSADAAAKIYSAKGRPSDNPLIVHVSEPAEAENIAFVPPIYYKLAKRFMPGALTVIMPKRSCIPDGVTGGLDTVAVRCPSHPAARALITASGVPIAAPSANRSGSPSPTTAEHVRLDMDGRVEMILDGGPCEIGLESTVIRLVGESCEILRPGAVTELMLAEVCREVSVARAVIDPATAGDKPLSPGMKYKHYAPEAEVVLVDASTEDFLQYVCRSCTAEEAAAVPDVYADTLQGVNLLSLGAADTAEEASRRMFSVLREADSLAYRKIYIRIPPAAGEYLALYNRLIRASGGKIVHIE